MSCYFRHLKPLFEKVGIVLTDANKKDVDRAIHDLLGIKYKDCSATWKEVKKRMAADEDAFATELRKKMAETKEE